MIKVLPLTLYKTRLIIQTTSKTNNVMYIINLDVLTVPDVQQMNGEQQFKYHIILRKIFQLKEEVQLFRLYTAFSYLLYSIYFGKNFYFLISLKLAQSSLLQIFIKLTQQLQTFIFQFKNNILKTMDFFDFPDDYVPAKPLTNQEMEEISNYLQNHPLFLKQMPKNIQQNQHLVALHNLIQNEDVNISAQSICNQGNETLKKNPDNFHYRKSAYQKYTQAINLKPTKPDLIARLHSNRALINLKSKNYGKVIIDCRICLKADPNYTKAYYRCAQAYIAVKRFKQALQLLKDRKQPELQQLRKQSQDKIEKQKKVEQKNQEKKEKQFNQVSQYCQNKKYHVIKRIQPLPQNAKIQLIDGKLSIPILFAYPQFGQMDLIAQTSESQKIKTYVTQLFEQSLPWDQKGQYNINSCELFCQLSQDKVMKIPKQAKIQDIAKRVPMKGALEILILAKENVFYNIFLKNKQIL